MAADQLAQDKARFTSEELKPIFRAFASSVGMYAGVAGCGGPAGYASATMDFHWSVGLGPDGALGRQGLERIQRGQVRMHCAVSGML